jgi:CO/xanthine dehydrogenase FAD-binding subunit
MFVTVADRIDERLNETALQFRHREHQQLLRGEPNSRPFARSASASATAAAALGSAQFFAGGELKLHLIETLFCFGLS